jgi:hypothetical protein
MSAAPGSTDLDYAEKFLIRASRLLFKAPCPPYDAWRPPGQYCTQWRSSRSCVIHYAMYQKTRQRLYRPSLRGICVIALVETFPNGASRRDIAISASIMGRLRMSPPAAINYIYPLNKLTAITTLPPDHPASPLQELIEKPARGRVFRDRPSPWPMKRLRTRLKADTFVKLGQPLRRYRHKPSRQPSRICRVERISDLGPRVFPLPMPRFISLEGMEDIGGIPFRCKAC